MRVAVIGAGMAGVAAAHALAAAGHEVTVIERRSSVAEETSFAPAGLAAPGLAAPWLVPRAGGLRARRGRDPEALRQGETGHACSSALRDPEAAAAQDRSARALHGLLRAGLERIETLARQQSADLERGRGLLVTLADVATLEQARHAVEWLRAVGETAEWADPARQREIEPGRLMPDDALPAVYLPSARMGNPREWTQMLRTQAQALGVRFLFQREAVEISPGRTPVVRHRGAGRGDAPSATAADDASPARTPLVRHRAAGRGDAPSATAADDAFDAVVVCAALESQRLLAPLGLQLPWRPVRGWSVTVPLHLREAAPDIGPRAALFDVREGISIARLGTRVRVAGGHESVATAMAAAREAPDAKTLQPLYDALDRSYPGSVYWNQAQGWQAVRPALSDGLPVVGPSGLEGVWLDTGHAHHGWALGQVAAEALCAMMAGLPPETDASALAPSRFA